jgi:hypothetical protein
VERHDDRLAFRVAVVLRAREETRVSGRQVLLDLRRRRLPEAWPADIEMEKSVLLVVARAAALELPDLEPEGFSSFAGNATSAARPSVCNEPPAAFAPRARMASL